MKLSDRSSTRVNALHAADTDHNMKTQPAALACSQVVDQAAQAACVMQQGQQWFYA